MKSTPSSAPFLDSSKADNTEAALDALHSLRRGLSRAHGFSLFVAVCNSSEEMERFIAILADALPHGKLAVARFNANTINPLHEVLSQAPEPAGPVIIMGLEQAVSQDRANHPILQTLNVQRPDWPQKVRQPVVLGMPESLLSTVAREAPDFLDWRSDTVHFPDLPVRGLQPLRTRFRLGAVRPSCPIEEGRLRKLTIEEARERALSVLCQAEEERTRLALREAKVGFAIQEELGHDL